MTPFAIAVLAIFAAAGTVINAATDYETLNNSLGQVEARNGVPDAMISGTTSLAKFRGVVDTTGRPMFLPNVMQGGAPSMR